jgi:hypothetical protein
MERNMPAKEAADWRRRPRGPRPDLADRNRANVRHGRSHSRVYAIWQGMLARCSNPNCKDYSRYGGRGIIVCERWLTFENFLQDMGEPLTGASIERQNNSQGYEPDNCRWASSKEQARNRRNNLMIEFNGEAKPVAQWAEELGIERKALEMRLRSWSIDRAFTTPYKPRGKE